MPYFQFSTYAYLHMFTSAGIQMPIPRPAKAPSWQEHRLPDGSLYWSRPLALTFSPHSRPILAVVTDIDLRETEVLARVDDFLSHSSPDIEKEVQFARHEHGFQEDSGKEVWLTLSSGGPIQTTSSAFSSPVQPSYHFTNGLGTDSEFKTIWIDHNSRTVKGNGNSNGVQDEIIYRKPLNSCFCSMRQR